ncbi:GTP-binding protein [Haliea sp. E1-2-M8]|uniref:CobW family GTP-binding protein n=1 Tax=Haliea sp. E1-2-M8 TaxID=3064706 RepID=UPI00272543A7|nr:GTP-binding protein [Haliea sp. E1-2-M8]MDO8861557.1 GTP-binding protein [Haliea sp. E1-2-M8]
MLKPPCSIVTGFLGSGKTTLLQHVLLEGLSGGPVAIIMNELGEIGIDGNVITDFQSVEKMVELNSGCVCCTISELQLGQALNEIVEEISPLLIIIETTGIAEPGPIVGRLRTFGYNIESVVTVVDAISFPGEDVARRTIENQIQAADFLVLNKTDGVDRDRLSEIISAITQLNPRAHLVHTNYGRADPRLLFTAGTKKQKQSVPEGGQLPARGHHDHRRGAGHVDTFSFSCNHPLDLDRLKAFLAQLPKEIIRAKGILRRSGDAAPLLFNYVCGRFDFRDLPNLKDPVATQAVFIGEINGALKDNITGQLRSLELRS